MGKKLSDIRTPIVRHPNINKEDLAGIAISLTGARGPYPGEYKGKPTQFIVVSIMIEESADEYDVILSYQEQGERAEILAAFKEDPALVIGPVMLASIELPNGNPFWQFSDIEE